MMVLGCDLGGTNVRVRLARGTPEGTQTVAEHHYRSAQHADLESVLLSFLQQTHTAPAALSVACIAVAGPVEILAQEQRARITNLPWVVDSAALRQRLGLPYVELINDFQAIGYGLATLGTAELLTLQPGTPRARAPKALLGAGTGLGQALLVWCGTGYEVIPTEGGHCDFGPGDPLETGLLEALSARLGRVSYEDLLSGPGLVRIAEFLAQQGPYRAGPALASAPADELPAVIGAAAVAGSDPLAMATVDRFLGIYGAQAGNLALASLALGGIYVAGGIAPKLSALFPTSPFLTRFRAKGPMSQLMERFPVHVVLNPDIGLDGAVHCAWRRSLQRQAGLMPV